jgi:hypothetical protein
MEVSVQRILLAFLDVSHSDFEDPGSTHLTANGWRSAGVRMASEFHPPIVRWHHFRHSNWGSSQPRCHRSTSVAVTFLQVLPSSSSWDYEELLLVVCVPPR